MERSISGYEAPALLDLHTTLTRLDLYEKIKSGAKGDAQPTLASAIAGRVMEFVADDNRWDKPVQHDLRKGVEDGLAIPGHARVYRTAQGASPFLAAFVHLAGYQYSQLWGKAGIPPIQFVAQANWAMMLGDEQRFAYVVLADRSTHIYWIDRDEAMIQRLKDALADMKRRIDENDAPPVDASPEPVVATTVEPGSYDLDEVAGRYRVAQAERADLQNRGQLAEQAFEAAKGVLLKAIPAGGHHDYEGVRIHHNAKTDRLTEEKIDGQYF